uniref:Uncharacterized protein n=1 Tax=Sarcophilus harrisii TaxID=9305 RepID=A0A7N4NFX5_SARHA
MYSLTFLSAQQLAKDEEATCKILEYLPPVTYKILFNVAFRDNRIKLLYELVKTWPYSELKFQMLLQTCWCCSRTSSKTCPECQWTFVYDKLSRNKIDTVILGVRSYIKKVITEGSQQPPDRYWQFCVWIPGSMAHTKYFSSFVSDCILAQDEEKMCKILKFMPQNMFEILFKVAFRNNKTKLLYELLKIWPHSQLKFQKLLQTCPFDSGTSKRYPQYQWPLTYNESNKDTIDAIVLGVLGYIRKVIICGAQQIPCRFVLWVLGKVLSHSGTCFLLDLFQLTFAKCLLYARI